MSKNDSPRSFQIDRSAFLFAIVVLCMGALLLAVNGLGPASTNRGQFTPTAPPWHSADGIAELDLPSGWTVRTDQSASPFTYVFSPATNPGVIVFFGFGQRADVAVKDTSPTASAEDLLRAAMTLTPGMDVKAVKVKDFKGGMLENTSTQTNPQTGQAQQITRSLYLLNVDLSHVLLIQAYAPAAEWPQWKPAIDGIINSITFNTDVAIKALDARSVAQTATAAAKPSATPTAVASVTATPAK